jgi:hypothetical protein
MVRDAELWVRKCWSTRWPTIAVIVLVSTFCQAESGLVPTSQLPYIYVLLSSEPLAVAVPSSDSSLVAFLLTAGSPTKSPFRHASRFELRAASANKPFKWVERAQTAPTESVGYRGVPADSANYFLPNDSIADGLGRKQLHELLTYTLVIESDGVAVTGTTTIPAKPLPRLFVLNEKIVVNWARAPGALSYYVESDTEDAPGFISTDTSYALRYSRQPSTIPTNPEFRIIALDANATHFFIDGTTPRSGIDNGFGLYGSATSARLALPKTANDARAVFSAGHERTQSRTFDKPE